MEHPPRWSISSALQKDLREGLPREPSIIALRTVTNEQQEQWRDTLTKLQYYVTRVDWKVYPQVEIRGRRELLDPPWMIDQ